MGILAKLKRIYQKIIEVKAIKKLKSHNSRDCFRAIENLRDISPTNSKIISAIARAAEGDGNTNVRFYAVASLAEIQPVSPEAIAVLARILNNNLWPLSMRHAAVRALEKLVPVSREAASVLLKSLDGRKNDSASISICISILLALRRTLPANFDFEAKEVSTLLALSES